MGQRLIGENIAKLRAQDQTRVLPQDACKLGGSEARFDVIFMDPPYGTGLGQAALARLVAGNWLGQDAVIIWEDNRAQDAPDGFDLEDQRRYGDTHISILRMA